MNASASDAPSSLSRLTSLELCARRPKLEQSAPALWQVLKACVFLDKALKSELAVLFHASARAPVCGAGCGACCCQPIPLSLAEAVAIRKFLRLTALPPPTPDPKGDPNHCPFMENGHCTIYPIRPFACRRFMVFNHCCAPGEDPTVTRPEDVLRPSRKILFETLCLTLPVYQALGLPVPDRVTLDFFIRHTSLTQAFPWREGEDHESESLDGVETGIPGVQRE